MQKETSKLLKETYCYTRLDCGLPLFFIPKRQFHKKMFILVTDYGSIDLEFMPSGEQNFIKVPAGVAHFLEHELFKKKDYDISERFARSGASYNASTGHTSTAYFFTCADNFRENVKTLLQLVFDPYFTEENVAREKLIIEQELKMYDDMPESKMMRTLMENLYQNHPIRVDIGGTVDSIKQITPAILRQCYGTFYHPANMVGVIAGDVDFSIVQAELNNYFEQPETKSLFNPMGSGQKEKHKTILPPVVIKRKTISEPAAIKQFSSRLKIPVARPQILIGYKEFNTGLEGLSLVQQNITTGIMLDLLLGSGSHLYNRLYEEGLVDDHFNFSYSGHQTYGVTIMGGETDQPLKLHERILGGLKKNRKDGLKKRDLLRIKRKVVGHYVHAFDSPESITGLFSGCYFNRVAVFELIKYLKDVSAKEINKRMETHLDEKYHAISVLEPAH
ncbi:MAG: pitrilysin family protein [Planctomycetota bacterium]